MSYENGEKALVLEPLKGQIDPEASSFAVGKVKVEIRLVKRAFGRWGQLVGDSPDRESRLCRVLLFSVPRCPNTPCHVMPCVKHLHRSLPPRPARRRPAPSPGRTGTASRPRSFPPRRRRRSTRTRTCPGTAPSTRSSKSCTATRTRTRDARWSRASPRAVARRSARTGTRLGRARWK